MSNKILLPIIFLTTFVISGHSQSETNLRQINKIWDKFYQAFDTSDHELMAEIHSSNLVRIASGKRISDYETCMNNYRSRFENAFKNNISNKISLRFFERISNDSIASEKGIYKLTRTENDQNERIYYGQFHVLFTKENNSWKILMDYDSNFENSIGEKDYKEAYGIDEIDRFIKE